MPLTQTVAPTAEPITLQEVKDAIYVTENDQDQSIKNLILTAIEVAQAYTKRQFITATYRLTLNGFARKIKLPRPPLGSVSSITYTDTAGATQTLASTVYQVVNDGEGAYLREAYAQTWPSLRYTPECVTITYTAGYGATGVSVPASIRQALMMLVRYWFKDCGCEVGDMPMAVRTLLDMNKVWDLVWSAPAECGYEVSY